MRLARNVRSASVALIPLLVAAVWVGVWQTAPRLEHFWWASMNFTDGGLVEGPPPKGTTLSGLPAHGLSWAIVREQAGGLVWPLFGGAVLVLLGLVAAAILALRRRRFRRWRRLPLRAGVLTILLGIAAAATLAACDFVVLRELGDLEFWVGSDRASTPWGSFGVAALAVLVGFAGILASAVVTIVGSLIGDRS